MGNGWIPALWEQGVLRSTTRRAASAVGSLMESREEVLLEESFRSMLTLERRRAERSRKPFVLMLLDASAFIEEKTSERFLGRICSVLLKSTRETDLIGWYEKGVVLGVIFTEVGCENAAAITEILRSKVMDALHSELGRKVASSLVVTTHLFPEETGQDKGDKVADTRFYPDLAKATPRKRVFVAYPEPLACDYCDCNQADLRGAGDLPARAAWPVRIAFPLPEVPHNVREQRSQDPSRIRAALHQRA